MRPLKAPMLVVAISALLALVFTIATQPSSDKAPRPAGEASIQLMKDEHALVADRVRDLQNTVKAERLTAMRERSEMQSLAVVDIKHGSPPAVVPSRTS
jgi:hypothetical protein